MTVKHRIEAFSALGDWIRQALEKGELLPIMGKAEINNPWFTVESQKLAINGILEFINPDSLTEWTSSYKIKDQGLWIGIVMAESAIMKYLSSLSDSLSPCTSPRIH